MAIGRHTTTHARYASNLPIWICNETPGLTVHGGRRRAAGSLFAHRLVLLAGDFGDDFSRRQRIGVRHVDGLAMQTGDA
jgi:hypothetical protein